ncbi:MAG: small subunit ribosomal protein [Solirubrobacterales bacterium]|jgi:small subunit ribosomal protein S6|nr:small subunit ribosomal protein [Solirubrobacterales bacterium]
MLDPGPDEAGRDVLAQDVKSRIEGKGTLKHENKWGLRKMAYEIELRNEADYRWFRFEAPTELLDELNHNLKIADGVLRFRIFKVDVDSPVLVPPAVAAPAAGASRDRGDRGDRGPQGDPRAAVAAESAEPAAAEPAESAAEPAESAPESADVPVAADE